MMWLARLLYKKNAKNIVTFYELKPSTVTSFTTALHIKVGKYESWDIGYRMEAKAFFSLSHLTFTQKNIYC